MQHAAPRPTPASGDAQPAASAERPAVEAYYRDVAPFYDADLTARGDLDLWRRVAQEHRGGTMLELGAGSGRVTEVLAPAAGSLVALDLSPDLLALAAERLAPLPHARLVRGDMVALPFATTFDLIVAANDPFSHIVEAAERDRILAEVARHLAPGGRFVLDALWLPPAAERAVSERGGRVERRTSAVDGRRVGVVERWRRTSERDRRCRAQYAYYPEGGPAVVAEFEARAWSPVELMRRLGRAGLLVTAAWGDYDGRPWNGETSSQLIVSATLA